ncbi:hypothetical protein [Desulfosoma caldarium]|uniref:MotA/TolQ/ExbB proton channel family protein n=1 Tax=Desulfosoma caldarium TaxID=610254 RepID=A0A3N1UMD4_9BACT|nr:hypothetical protein [Desulfosoma caldarium]ROQ89597.1 hypothetical protein EDC27_3134 [Desulfosoma caldarium]
MEYGIRRYESTQRLWWFAFLLMCLAAGFPFSAQLRSAFSPSLPHGSLKPQEALQRVDFWLSAPWANQGLLGLVIFYLFGVLCACLMLRALWLLVQVWGTFLVARSLRRHVKSDASGKNSGRADWFEDNAPHVLSLMALARDASRLPWSLFSLAHKRLRLLVFDGRGTPSSNEMVHREQRLEGLDWHLVLSSWDAFRSISRALPLLGFVQSCWVFYLWLQPVIDGALDAASNAVVGIASLLALVHTVAATLVFGLGFGFLSRLERLYLSRLDGLFYDQLLSRMPLHNADTLVILKTLSTYFRKLQERIKRLEEALLQDRL